MNWPTSGEFGVKPLALLGLILAIAAAVRFHDIGRQSMWMDEQFTVEQTTAHGMAQFDYPQGVVLEHPLDVTTMANADPWYYILPRSEFDSHPPLIHLLLRLWRQIAPDTDGWVRTFPALLSLAAIAMLYFAVATQAGPGPALWACLIMSLACVQVEYAQECRNYTLTLFCLLSSSVAVLRMEKFGFNFKRGVALTLFAFAACFAHYLALPQLGLIFLYILIRLQGRDRTRAVISLVIAGVFYCIIWGPFAIHQSHGFLEKIGFTQRAGWSAGRWLYLVAGLPMQFLIYLKPQFDFLRWVGPLFILIPLPFLRNNRAMLFWWLWLAGGIGAVALWDLIRHTQTMSYPRYTIAITPAIYAVVSLLLWNFRGWRRHVVPCAVALACAIALPWAQFRIKPDWKGFDKLVAANLGPDDIRVMYDMREPDWRVRCDLVGMMYYDHEPRGAVVFLSAPPSPEIEKRIRAARSIWFYATYFEGEAQTILPGARIIENHTFPLIGTFQRIEWPAKALPATAPQNGP